MFYTALEFPTNCLSLNKDCSQIVAAGRNGMFLSILFCYLSLMWKYESTSASTCMGNVKQDFVDDLVRVVVTDVELKIRLLGNC